MKILLIYPKNVDTYYRDEPYPPLGLLYLAAYARDMGYSDIKILDCVVDGISQDSLYNEIAMSDIIGVGGFTSQFKHAIEISRICKELNKPSVCGGVHVSSDPAGCLKASEFDIAVKGEGEVTFYELLKLYSNKDRCDLKGIDGLLYKSNGGVVENKNRAAIENLDSLSYPARDLLDMGKYKIRDEFYSSFFTIIQSTRGCPFECTFCNSPKMWHRKMRARSAQHLVSEMSELYHRYGFRCVHISDDGFTYRRDVVKETCSLIIEKGLDIEWACVSRPELVDAELLQLMRKSGCIRISIGVESADLKIIEQAKKRYSLKKIAESAELIKKSGILLHCYMMIGLPGETLRTYWKSIAFMRKIKPDRVGWAVVVPYPGTELFEKKMVDIVNRDYLNWGGYLNPVIKVGLMQPVFLRILQLLANFLTQKRYQKRSLFVSLTLAFSVYLPGYLSQSVSRRLRKLITNR